MIRMKKGIKTISDTNGKEIINCIPKILAVVNVFTIPELEPTPHLRMVLVFPSGKVSKEFMVPLFSLDTVNLTEYDLRVRYNPDASQSKAKRYIADYVRSALPKASVKKLYRINQLGAHEVEGEIVFNTGKGLVRPLAGAKTDINIEVVATCYSFDIDSDISEEEAAAGMLELVALSPNAGRVILAQNLLYLKRNIYADIWKSPCCIVFLHGPTGTQKTTISQFLSQLHNRSKGIESPIRLNASVPAAVKVLYQKSDCVIVLDDFFQSESSSVNQQQIKTMFEIIRMIADGVEPARVRGNEVAKAPPTCGVLLTGEYVVGTGSDAARFLPVEMTPPDGKRLRKFQDKPLIVSTFYHFFVQWFIERYDDIKVWLREWLDCYHKSDFGVHDRLREAHFFLGTAYCILLQYLHEKGYIAREDAERLHQSFQSLLTDLVKAQNLRVEQGSQSEPARVDLLTRIRTMYQNNELNLANTAHQFTEAHDGCIHNGYLCLHGDAFRNRVCKPASITDFNDILDVWEAQGISKRDKGKRTMQIFATGGRRFYAIKLDVVL